jgi:transcription termination/antitermination protein NusG
MSETDYFERPNATEADESRTAAPEAAVDGADAPGTDAAEIDHVMTETEEAAALEERAEAGDEAAELALEEAGGSEPPPDEAPSEAVGALASEEPLLPEDDLTDVPTEEATVFEAEAEAVLPEDIIEGEDEGPWVSTGPDTYLEPETVEALEAEAAPVEEPVEAAEPEEAVELEEAVEPEAPKSPFDPPGDWYVIHTYAGYENKVKANLNSRIGSMQMEDKIFAVHIPMEDVMEIKGGKKQVVQKKVFPGYLLVKMIYDNDSWYVVRNTPGVTGFVSSGTGTKPTPLSRREVEKILVIKQETQVKPQYRLEWEEGDVVRIIAGPFADFTGTIAEINVEQSKLKVMVNIFDRETPVELAFDQVAKA